MVRKNKQIPEEFKTYEEAAEFWDTHDSTGFISDLEEVDIKVSLQKRHYLLELDINTAELLHENARKKGINPNDLVSKLLHEQLV